MSTAFREILRPAFYSSYGLWRLRHTASNRYAGGSMTSQSVKQRVRNELAFPEIARKRTAGDSWSTIARDMERTVGGVRQAFASGLSNIASPAAAEYRTILSLRREHSISMLWEYLSSDNPDLVIKAAAEIRAQDAALALLHGLNSPARLVVEDNTNPVIANIIEGEWRTSLTALADTVLEGEGGK